MTKKNMLRSCCILVLCLAICLSSVACGRGNGGETSAPVGTTGTGTMDYTICITAETGTPLEEIGVYIYTDSTLSELVWFAKTDAEGKLSFTDIPSDNFVAVLDKVPAGYLVEEYYPLTGELTQITLSAGLMEGDLSSITYKLGDLMMDFSVTAPDGTVYKFSELLEQKKAVILNFWYLQCEPCKAEFPHLQEAYEQYSDDVALLVMNPVNQDNGEIEKFRKDNEYTFSMMACDPLWEKAMQLTAYPTTVVVDRFGYITLRHTGSIDGPEIFEAMMRYFSADEYEHTVFKNLDELAEAAGVEQEVGTAENPIEMGLTSSFQVTIEPGQELHYNVYRISKTITFSMSNPNAYVIYNGKQYNGPNITFSVSTDGPNTPAKFVFGNNGKETQTYTVYLGHKQGSSDNPYSLKLDEGNTKTMEVNVAAGNSDGVWYRMASPGDGFLTIELESATAGTKYEISVTSVTESNIPVQEKLNGETEADAESGKQKLVVKVFKGGKVDVSFGSLDNSYPAIAFKLNLSFVEGDVSSALDKQILYSVNVTDENRKPVEGIVLDVDMNGVPLTIVTDETGAASTKLDPGAYKVTMREPNGYRAKNLTYKLTEKTPSISIRLQTVITKDYKVTVKDEQGNAVPGAFVSIGNMSFQTDENGVAVFKLEEGSYTATVKKIGYYELGDVKLSVDSPETTAVIQVNPYAHFIDYTVYVLKYDGTKASNVKVNFLKNGITSASVTTDSNGKAVQAMEPGEYTVAVAEPYYLASGNTVLTEAAPEVNITVVQEATTKPENFTANVGVDSNGFPIQSTYSAYPVSVGATYVKLNSANESYYLFNPGTASGYYKATVIGGNAIMSKWTGTGYKEYDNVSEVTINHKADILSDYVIGIKGSGGAILVITRVSDFIKDENDIPYDVYQPKTTPKSFTITAAQGAKLTYVDLSGKTEDYQIVLGSDGYYHLNSATGPLLYINLGPKAPYKSLYAMSGVGANGEAGVGIKATIKKGGEVVAKYDFTDCVQAYGACMDPNYGIYPLTEDLVFVVQTAGEVHGWWDSTSNEFWLQDVANLNPELGWMFAVCYVK